MSITASLVSVSRSELQTLTHHCEEEDNIIFVSQTDTQCYPIVGSKIISTLQSANEHTRGFSNLQVSKVTAGYQQVGGGLRRDFKKNHRM